MTRHVEFEIKGDITCWSPSKEDFEHDNDANIFQDTCEYLYDGMADFFDNIKITKVWYEED